MRSVFLALVLALVAAQGCGKKVATGPRPKLELATVDDTAHPFAGMTFTPPIAVHDETVGMSGTSTTVEYVTIPIPAGEPKRAERELRAAVSSAPLPSGARFAFGPDRADGGIRSYVLTGAAILTEADVESAKSGRDESHGGWFVTVTFTPHGAAVFEDYTTHHVDRRIAIVVDDVVQSAPVIRSAIGGGVVQITMGGVDEAQSERDAKRIASGFGGQ